MYTSLSINHLAEFCYFCARFKIVAAFTTQADAM